MTVAEGPQRSRLARFDPRRDLYAMLKPASNLGQRLAKYQQIRSRESESTRRRQSSQRCLSIARGLGKTLRSLWTALGLRMWRGVGCWRLLRRTPECSPPTILRRRPWCDPRGRAPRHSETRAPTRAFADYTAAVIVRISVRPARALLPCPEFPECIQDARAHDTKRRS